jgi:hypothetical protein
MTSGKKTGSAFCGVTGLFPCSHAAEDMGDLTVTVLCKDTCCNTCLVTGIAIDNGGFIHRDFSRVAGRFVDINMV